MLRPCPDKQDNPVSLDDFLHDLGGLVQQRHGGGFDVDDVETGTVAVDVGCEGGSEAGRGVTELGARGEEGGEEVGGGRRGAGSV